MLPSILLLLLGLAILTAGAEALVRGASGIALKAGLSPLVVGLTVVAFGTSAPELAVSVKSALSGSGDIAAGNIIGSNIFNIAVILGISALVCPLVVHLQILRWDMPIMLGVSVLGVVFFKTGGVLERWEAALLFTGIVTYTTLAIRMARKETKAAQAAAVGDDDSLPATPGNLPLAILLVLAGLAMLVGGAQLLVDNAITIAHTLKISDAIIGLTIVAAGTSLPELATSLVAALRKHTDIAIGNIVGSNLFNLLSIGGLAGLIHPIHAGGVTNLDYGFMIGTAVLLLPLMRSGFVIKRWEGGLLLASYVAYMVCLWPK